MTRHLTRPRAARWALLAVVALVVAGLRLASASTSTTTASWTDDVRTTTAVTLGTWTVAPPAPSCTVVRVATGAVEPTYSCTIASSSPATWYEGNHQYQKHYEITYLHPGNPTPQMWLPADLQVRFDITLPSDGAPAWWQWAGSGLSAQTNPAFTLTTRCSDLPRVAGTLVPSQNYMHWVVDLTPTTPNLCPA